MLHRGGGDVHAISAVDQVVLCAAVKLVGNNLQQERLSPGEFYEGLMERFCLPLAGQIPLHSAHV